MADLEMLIRHSFICRSIVVHFIVIYSQSVLVVDQTRDCKIAMFASASPPVYRHAEVEFDISQFPSDDEADMCTRPKNESMPHPSAVAVHRESSLALSSLFYRRFRSFHFAGQDIVIRQNYFRLGVAGVVWESAIQLCGYLERNADLVKGRTVVELGAGSGIVGITAAYLGGKVTVTDRDVVMDYLSSVVNDNTDEQQHSISVKTLDWTRDLGDFPETFQVILAADVIYVSKNLEHLLETFRHLSNDNTLILISAEIRRDRDTNFLDLMRKEFVLKKVFRGNTKNLLIYKAHKR